MRITVNLNDALVEKLDISAEAHHESRAEFAGKLIESQITSQNKIHEQYIKELNHRDSIIKRLTDEIQGLRRLLDEARGEAEKKGAILEGESGAILAAKNLRIEELSASVAQLEAEAARAPAAGDVARLENDVADLRGQVQERDVQVARLVDMERELSQAGERERRLVDLIYQEKGEKKALLERLPLLPAPKEGFFRGFLGAGGRNRHLVLLEIANRAAHFRGARTVSLCEGEITDRLFLIVGQRDRYLTWLVARFPLSALSSRAK